MRMILFHLPGVRTEALFGEERLVNFRHLMGLGAYGFLDRRDAKIPEWMVLAWREAGDAGGKDDLLILWEYLKEAGKRCLVVGDSPKPVAEKMQNSPEVQAAIQELHEQGHDDYFVLKQLLSSQEWDYCQFIDAPDRYERQGADAYIKFDHEFGDVLGQISDETIILVSADLVGGDKPGCFLLVAPNNPLVGEHTGGEFYDIAPTLLEMAGYPLPETTLGTSWIAGMDLGEGAASSLTEEEEAILRERLSGLGYI